MAKQSVEEIKEKMRKLLEDAMHNEDKEPQSIGNPERIFDKEDNEDGESVPTEKQQQSRDKGSKGKD
jgi:hypothetical protein